MKDYIDITPKGVDAESEGQVGRKSTVLQETEKAQVLQNTGRLTKEGVEEKILLWKQSHNTHTLLKYKHMLRSCDKLKPSGKTEEGHIILSYGLDGQPDWVKKLEEKKIKK